MRAATPSWRRPSSSMYSPDTGAASLLRAASGDERVVAHVARLRDERLLVGIAVRDQLAVGRDDQREAVLADADLIDHPPHLFEAELADEPAGRLVQARQVDGEDDGRQQVLVDADRRHRDAVDDQRARLSGTATRGCADAARGDHRAGFVEQRDLAELAELQDVVLEDPILLPCLEAGVLQVGGERLQQRGVGDDVAADFLGGAGGDVLVAGDDRLAGAALERQDRDEAVGEQRHDGGDAPAAARTGWRCAGFSSLISFGSRAGRRSAGCQRRRVLRMSRPARLRARRTAC